jgi:hypothetical protein
VIDVKHCSGCVDDSYNDHNPYGVKACWLREGAKLEPRLLIHIDQVPPYRNVKPITVPTCYKMPRYVTAKLEAIDANGYWKA